MRFLTIFISLLLTFPVYGQQYGTVREVPNYYGGYNYYLGTKLVVQTRQGISREHIYQGTRKIGELRTNNNTRTFYPSFKFNSGKISINKK